MCTICPQDLERQVEDLNDQLIRRATETMRLIGERDNIGERYHIAELRLTEMQVFCGTIYLTRENHKCVCWSFVSIQVNGYANLQTNLNDVHKERSDLTSRLHVSLRRSTIHIKKVRIYIVILWFCPCQECEARMTAICLESARNKERAIQAELRAGDFEARYENEKKRSAVR